MSTQNLSRSPEPADNPESGRNAVKAVLFDLDGVLIDATEWHFVALNRALEMFGFTISRYQHMADYNGLPTRKKLQMLTVEKGLPPFLHDLINRLKQTYTMEEIMRNCSPSFEKEYMIRRLQREGYRLAVCSNAIRESVDIMLKKAGILPFFEFVISNEDVERPKPDPQMYEIAINRMGIQPAEALIVEDAPHGIEAAHRSGAHVCEVAGFSEVDYQRIAAALRVVSGEQPC
jgi:HAD superfamily hydrolase (TIGR01509 family)